MDVGLYIATPGMPAEPIRPDRILNDLVGPAMTGAAAGWQSTAVQVDKIRTDFSPRPSRETGQPLDFAITGEGFFAVRTRDGVRYTRNGRFTVSPQELLVTAAGDPVLGHGERTVRVGADGRVDPRALDLVRLEIPRKDGIGLVAGNPAGTAGLGQVRAGALEASASDAARSMVDMFASLRSFGAGPPVITTIDETPAKAASQLGSVGGG